MSETFSSRSMLAGLHIEAWSATRKDNKATATVHSAYQSSGDSGHYRKALLPKEALREVQQAANAMRSAHAERTLPWSQDGMRILPAAMHADYTDAMRKLKNEWERAVEAFAIDYPRYVSDAQIKLNGLFNPRDYPNPRDIAAYFQVRFDVLPFPDVQDFRVDLSDAEMADIQARAGEQIQNAKDTAMKDVWRRLRDVIFNAANKLAEVRTDKQGNPQAAIFRDSLIENIRDLCGLIPALNITGDPDLEQLRVDTLAALGNLNPEHLRESTTARDRAANSAQALLDRLQSYTGGVSQ